MNKVKEADKCVSIYRAMLTAYDYNMDEEKLIKVCNDILYRLERIFGNIACVNPFTDEGDFIFATLVIMFGEYGVSPNFGWFDNDILKERLVKTTEEFIEKLKKRGEDE